MLTYHKTDEDQHNELPNTNQNTQYQIPFPLLNTAEHDPKLKSICTLLRPFRSKSISAPHRDLTPGSIKKAMLVHPFFVEGTANLFQATSSILHRYTESIKKKIISEKKQCKNGVSKLNATLYDTMQVEPNHWRLTRPCANKLVGLKNIMRIRHHSRNRLYNRQIPRTEELMLVSQPTLQHFRGIK